MTLRHDDQSVTFKVEDTKTFSYNIIKSVNRVDVIDIACEEYVQEVLEISESGNPNIHIRLMIDSRSPYSSPLTEEMDPNLPPSPVYEINVPKKIKSSCEDPPDLELKDLPSHLDIVYTDIRPLKYLLAKQDAKPRLLRWILLLQEFDVVIRDKKGAENLAADHLSRLENPHQTPCFADFANYNAGNLVVSRGYRLSKKKVFQGRRQTLLLETPSV
ncbi:hypothetical protein Tco_0233523 [Tanacetum coccineum]